jgi:predicted TIM-barrel fold metal-dependent hydrolase
MSQLVTLEVYYSTILLSHYEKYLHDPQFAIPTVRFSNPKPFVRSGSQKHYPIIDVHVHAFKANPNTGDLCPWFLKNMPGADPHNHGENPSIFNLDCPDPLKAAKTDKEMQETLLATAERLNVTMIVSGDAGVIHNWYKAAPNRIIPSLGISSNKDMTVKAFEDSLTAGFYKVMGEVAPQYQGMSPSDVSLDEYFAVAERLGVPVGIHMGTGGNGNINISNPKYRASLGRPFCWKICWLNIQN